MRKRLMAVAAVLLAVVLMVGIGRLGEVPAAATYQSEQSAPMGDALPTGSTVLYGDVNSDGRLNNKDLGLLQQYLAGWDVSIQTAVSDLDGDGDVDEADFDRLLQYLNGWDVEFVTTTTTSTTSSTTESTTSSTTESTTSSTTESTTQPTEPQKQIALPAEGLRLDNRIRVKTVSYADGVVTLVLRNTSSGWEVDDSENSYMEYTCYDENGQVVFVDVVPLGYIPTSASKTYLLSVPEYTAKVELTDFEAEY